MMNTFVFMSMIHFAQFMLVITNYEYSKTYTGEHVTLLRSYAVLKKK